MEQITAGGNDCDFSNQESPSAQNYGNGLPQMFKLGSAMAKTRNYSVSSPVGDAKGFLHSHP